MKSLSYYKYRLQWNLAPWILPSKPLHLDIELTSACNLKCVFCPQSEDKKSFKVMHMHIGTFRRIVDEAEILGVPSIKLNLRGESTLHPYFFEACRYVKNKFIDIRINTNGNYPSTMNHYMADTFTEISVSVDADNPLTYGRIRKGGRLAVVEDNILRLYNMMNHSKQTLRLSFVITKTNRKQVESFKKKWKETCPDIKFFIRHAAERTQDIYPYATETETATTRKNCQMPSRRLTILQDGTILGCCVAAWKEHDMYRLNNRKSWCRSEILTAWNGEKTKKLRAMLANGEAFKQLYQCKGCYSRESYNWVPKGESHE